MSVITNFERASICPSPSRAAPITRWLGFLRLIVFQFFMSRVPDSLPPYFYTFLPFGVPGGVLFGSFSSISSFCELKKEERCLPLVEDQHPQPHGLVGTMLFSGVKGFGVAPLEFVTELSGIRFYPGKNDLLPNPAISETTWRFFATPTSSFVVFVVFLVSQETTNQASRSEWCYPSLKWRIPILFTVASIKTIGPTSHPVIDLWKPPRSLC